MNWGLFQNSLLVAGGTAVVAGALGFLAALLALSLDRSWRGWLVGSAVVTLALPPFLVANCWLHLLGHAGVWKSWLPLNLFTVGGVVWVLTLTLWPIGMMVTLGAWHRLEPWQLEADMAARGWALIRGILFPMAWPDLARGALLIFVLALNNFAVPALLQVKVFPAETWIRFSTTFDAGGALQLSWPMIIAPLLLLAWFSRGEASWPRLQARVSARLIREQLGGRWVAGCGLAGALAVALSLGVPVARLLTASRTWKELPGALAAGQGAVWNSFTAAFGAATVVLVLGIVAAGISRLSIPTRFRGSRRQEARTVAGDQSLLTSAATSGRALFNWASWIPLLVPGVVLGIAFVTLFNRPAFDLFYQSSAIVIAAFAIRYLGLGCNAVEQSAAVMDRDLADMARLEGAGPWQMLRHVYWPQMAPTLGAAWYIVFLLCLWDVESIILIYPPGGETLALRIFNLLHYGYSTQVNALCLVLVTVALAPLLLWSLGRAVLARRRSTPFAAAGTLALVLLGAGCGVRLPVGSAALNSSIFDRVEVIGARGVGVGQLNKPRSVAVDREDNLYVVDMTGRVQKFSPTGAFLLSWQMPQTDLGKPKGMCRDQFGNILVIEPHYSRVNCFSTSGQLLAQWGQRGTGAGQLSLPRAVAVDSRGRTFVSEYQEVERVQRFAAYNPGSNTAPKYEIGFGHAGTRPGEFNRPEGLCVDARDRVYVADSCNHRVEVFTDDGEFLRAYGKPGSGRGELSYPYDLCVDAAGFQFVCEFGNSRIQVFDAQDRPVEIIGGPGSEPGRFSNPWSVALDSHGNLYVADSQNHRVQKLIRRAPPVAAVARR